VLERPDGTFGQTIRAFTKADGETKEITSGVFSATTSGDGAKLLVSGPGNQWRVIPSNRPSPPGEGRLDTGSLRMKVDPAEEWTQIFDEAWRFQRDYFYVDNIHGADWAAVRARYRPWLKHVGHRSDLNHLLDVLGGETSVGHSFVGGGDFPDVPSVGGGLLGCDLEADGGHWRIGRIYDGESWNPTLRGPLAAPGLDVREGDVILSVNGEPLTTAVNPHRPFEGTAGRQVVLELAESPDAEETRTVTVVPIGSEGGLRTWAWVEDNRRRVDEASNGRLAYLWLPNTGGGGYTYFNRFFFAQQDRDGIVVDERFNGGGSAADYIVDLLARQPIGYFNNPIGEKRPFSNPNTGIWGPKVMIINESAGSGGDLLPYMFRAKDLGPLVGTRTWGGLVGIWDVPGLIDGGRITAPRGGFIDNDGRWAVENEGVAPDIEVFQTPARVAAGEDPQLEAAIDEALRLLEVYDAEGPKHLEQQPPDPVRAVRPRR